MASSADRGIAVALANWNGGGHITRCLDALLNQTRPPDEIVVVDNGSTDGSPDIIRRHYRQVRLITRPVNEGYCAGYNRAIRSTSRPFVLILNTDVFLNPDFIERAVSAIAEADDIGWVTGPVLRATDSGHDFHGCYLRRRIALATSRSPRDGEEVFAGSGAAIFCRRRMLDDVAHDGEVYDESFFAYIEDLDLAWRAQHRGWRCIYRSDVACRHLGSASQGGRMRVVDKSLPFLTHILKNRYLTLVKNATPGVAVRFLPAFVVGEAILWALLATRSPRNLVAIPRAIGLLPGLLGGALERRRGIMATRRVPDRRILSLTRGS